MANIQTEAYLMCYFHVNAIHFLTMTTRMIDRTEKVAGESI